METNHKNLFIKMKKIIMLLAGAMSVASMSAATLRVNNAGGSGAQYTTFDAAQAAAEDGDVIIFDGSPATYGTIEVSKRLTLQGPGYFLDVNNPTEEGHSPATFDDVTLRCDGAKVTGLSIEGTLKMNANSLVVTRCYVKEISLCRNNAYTEDYISNGIIHQNYILNGIWGDSYSAPAKYMQVTNNIIASGGNAMFSNMDNSVISRNTAISNESGVRKLTNCVIENNISCNIEDSYYANSNNTYHNNYAFGNNEANRLYGYSRTDASIRAVDATLATDKGAFSGEDPYVLSGVAAGPVLEDVIIPESVVQGEDLKVTVKIGSSR